ncbi:MAG: hypothetical protein RSA87_03580, partial [Malacoplasma sp.]
MKLKNKIIYLSFFLPITALSIFPLISCSVVKNVDNNQDNSNGDISNIAPGTTSVGPEIAVL